MRTALREYAPALGIYAITRILAGVFVLTSGPGRVVVMEGLLGYHSTATAALPPDYGTVMSSWDGQWYWDIAQNGYPDSAKDANGQPQQTSLAFFPLYPLLVRALMALTGLGFPAVAPALSVVLGGAAVLVVYRLVADAVDRNRALLTVALFCCFPAAPILQAAYTESLALLLIAAALLLIRRQRYGWAVVPVLLLALTRNVTLVLAPVVALHWWVRCARPELRRYGRVLPPPKRLVGLLVISLAATALWPALAGAITGEHDSYFTTMSAWPGYTASPLDPPWLAGVRQFGAVGWATLALLVTAFAVLVLGRSQRAWGPELWGWTVSYSTYIFLASGATGSIIRYLLLCFPFALVLLPPGEEPRERRARVLVAVVYCVLGLAAQYVWVSKFLVYSGSNGGWGYP